MKKWNLIIDVDNCTNCNMCTLASKDEHVGNAFPGYSAEMPKRGAEWIKIEKKERGQTPMIDIGYIPTMCQHCDDAPCMKVAKNNAITKRNDGIIIIDPEKSKGQKQIVDSCPHGSISWNEELKIPQIWFFDAHLLDKGWKEPRAVSVCATDAMKSLKVDDREMQKIVQKEKLEILNPEYNTSPRVYYKNLFRYNKCFIGGSVAKIKNKIEDLQLEDDIQFLGSLSQKKLAKLMRRSKLLIHSAEHETFGLVAVEAHRSGLPVISINQGPFKEIITNDKDGLITQSFESIQAYDFIIKLFEDSNFASELAKNAVQSSSRFNWELTTKDLNKIYKDIVI